jgi:hypothetical protein
LELVAGEQVEGERDRIQVTAKGTITGVVGTSGLIGRRRVLDSTPLCMTRWPR